MDSENLHYYRLNNGSLQKSQKLTWIDRYLKDTWNNIIITTKIMILVQM